MRILAATVLVLALAAGPATIAAGSGSGSSSPGDRAAAPERGRPCLAPARIESAERYAQRRVGRVSFAVSDECGRLVGSHRFRVHHSAGVVKVMMMVAYLNLDNVRDRGLRRSSAGCSGR